MNNSISIKDFFARSILVVSNFIISMLCGNGMML